MWRVGGSEARAGRDGVNVEIMCGGGGRRQEVYSAGSCVDDLRSLRS